MEQPVSKSAYIAFDVDRIKEFVFASHRPLDVSGASELVKILDDTGPQCEIRRWLARFGAFVIIYARGGSGMIRLLDGSRAPEVTCCIEREFRKTTVTGSCSSVFVEIPAQPPTNSAFQEALRLLGARLQRRKAEKAGEEPSEAWTMSYHARCQGCGLHPANTRDTLESELLCESCAKKRKKGRSEGKSQAQSFKDISETYLACFNADVDRAGRLLQLCRTEPQVSALSLHLYEAAQLGVQYIANKVGKGKYQSPIAGGDDIVAFLPAKGCVAIARETWKQVESKLKQVPNALKNTPLEDKLSHDVALSVGLLVASNTLPIPFLFEMTQALLKSAKTRSYKLADQRREQGEPNPADAQKLQAQSVTWQPDSALDFLALKGGSPISDSIESLRELYLQRPISPPSQFPSENGRDIPVSAIHMTRRPYSHKQFEKLAQKATLTPDDQKALLRSVAHMLEVAAPAEIYVYTAYQRARNLLSDQHDSHFLHRAELVDDKMVVTSGVLDLLELLEMDTL